MNQEDEQWILHFDESSNPFDDDTILQTCAEMNDGMNETVYYPTFVGNSSAFDSYDDSFDFDLNDTLFSSTQVNIESDDESDEFGTNETLTFSSTAFLESDSESDEENVGSIATT